MIYADYDLIGSVDFIDCNEWTQKSVFSTVIGKKALYLKFQGTGKAELLDISFNQHRFHFRLTIRRTRMEQYEKVHLTLVLENAAECTELSKQVGVLGQLNIMKRRSQKSNLLF